MTCKFIYTCHQKLTLLPNLNRQYSISELNKDSNSQTTMLAQSVATSRSRATSVDIPMPGGMCIHAAGVPAGSTSKLLQSNPSPFDHCTGGLSSKTNRGLPSISVSGHASKTVCQHRVPAIQDHPSAMWSGNVAATASSGTALDQLADRSACLAQPSVTHTTTACSVHILVATQDCNISGGSLSPSSSLGS